MSSGVGAQERVSVVGRGGGGFGEKESDACVLAWMPAPWLAPVSCPFPAIDTIDELTFN